MSSERSSILSGSLSRYTRAKSYTSRLGLTSIASSRQQPFLPPNRDPRLDGVITG